MRGAQQHQAPDRAEPAGGVADEAGQLGVADDPCAVDQGGRRAVAGEQAGEVAVVGQPGEVGGRDPGRGVEREGRVEQRRGHAASQEDGAEY